MTACPISGRVLKSFIIMMKNGTIARKVMGIVRVWADLKSRAKAPISMHSARAPRTARNRDSPTSR